MASHSVESLHALRKLIAEPPALMQKRLQPQIDAHCLTILQNASVCALGFIDPALDIEYFNLRADPLLYAKGERIVLVWPAHKTLPVALEQASVLACSLYFIMPGIGFALRANGRAAVRQRAAGLYLEFSADALFLHCSRAKVRAQFWEPRAERLAPACVEDMSALSDEALAFIADSPFVLMLTHNNQGATEISPRGDPDGFVHALDRHTLLIPERPGNKVACTLSNVLASGALTLSCLIPGSRYGLSVSGRAWLTSSRELLEPLAINGKVPVVATVLEVTRVRFQHCPELLAAGLWQADTHLCASAIPSFPKMLGEHMSGTGLLGKATTLVVDAVVKHDLKHLY